MNYCKRCRKKINEKYEYCWDCNEFLKNESKKYLKTFTCTNCHQTMYSMAWPDNLCCNCYNYKKKLSSCSINSINKNTDNKTLEDDVHET